MITARTPDVFIALGDMIYGDNPCTAVGRYGNAQIPGPPPARDRAGYWAHWRYNRADAASQRVLASTTYYAVWDDHEVRDDFGPPPSPGHASHLLMWESVWQALPPDRKSALELVRQAQNEVARGSVLANLIAHGNEEYGIMTVYIRTKGMVPPSTERGMRGRGAAPTK